MQTNQSHTAHRSKTMKMLLCGSLFTALLASALGAQDTTAQEGRQPERLFEILDADANALLTRDEVVNAVLTHQMLPPRELIVFAGEAPDRTDRPSRLSDVDPERFADRLFARADRDRDGTIAKDEFLNQTTRRRAYPRQD